MIDVTGIDLVEFAKKVYELSEPQGLGLLHYQEGGLSDGAALDLINKVSSNCRTVLDMDYVLGRACKMTVFQDHDKLSIRDNWYDHTDQQLVELLSAFDLKVPEKETGHGVACNCLDCQRGCERTDELK